MDRATVTLSSSAFNSADQDVVCDLRPALSGKTVRVTVLVQLLADLPDLIEPIGRMRFVEWGDDDNVDEWISTTRREAGREDLPVTWVAVDETGTALGAVALGPSDVPGRPELVPCVWGMVVRSDLRGRGIGRLLLQRLERYAADHRYPAVWVLTGPPAVGYYERCGWQRAAELPAGTLLRKQTGNTLNSSRPTS